MNKEDFTIPVTHEGELVGYSDGKGTIKFLSSELQDKIIKKIERPISASSRKAGTCYCGEPVDESNPDCVAFSLCRGHAMEA